MSLVFIAPLFISTDSLQKRALAQVESATGYRVRIDGPVRLAVFPSLDLVARDVGIAQPDQGGAAEFATARTLRFGLVLRSLLAGKVNLTEVTLVDPVITLPLPEKTAPRSAEPAGEGTAAQQDWSIHELTIRNGTVILPGENGEPGKQITSLNAEASLPRANGPLTFVGTARYDGDPVSAKGTIGSFAHFLDGGPAPVTLALQTPDLPDGATLTGAASYKGDVLTLVKFAAQSGPHKISGDATYREDTLTITQGLFDDTPFAGTAHLAGDTLTVDTEVAVEGKPVRLAGSLGTFDQFLAGGAVPTKLSVVAPEHLKDEVTLNGVVSYKDDTFTLRKFAAVSGEDTISGAAVYKDDVLTLSQVTAMFGDQTVSGDATYREDAVDLDVTVELDGKPAKVTGSITGIEKLLDGESASMKLEIDSPDRLPAKAFVTGGVFYKDDALVLTAFTVVYGDYAVTGNGLYKDDVLVLDPVKAQTSGQTASGTLTVNLAGDVPSLTGTFTATGAVKSKSGGVPAPKESTEAAQPAAETKSAPASTEPLPNPLAQPPGGGTEVAVAPPPVPEAQSGKTAPAAKPARTATRPREIGWRLEKLGFLALKDVNADVTVTFNQFVFEDIRIGAATVKVTLAGGKLIAETKDLKAYGGGGTMTLVLDASGAVPAHRLNLAVTGLDAYPFLDDVADFRTIEGKAAIAFDLSASGGTESAMVSSLNGTAKFDFTNGALRGINVANMLRTLTTGILTGWQFKQEAKTVFDKLGASFKIAGGQAQTDDLRMTGPLVSIGGAGTVDIPAQRLKFRVNPFMLASVESKSGKNNMLGFPVPIAVSGPWDNPSIYPDIVGVLESPVAAYQQLNKLGGGLISMPTNLLGIETGEGGLVEKSVAIPGAVTKGVVGGIGQMLGVKKRQDPKATPSARGNQPNATAPDASEAQPQKPTAETAQKEKSAAEPTPNQTFQSTFGQ
ncbi:MAG: AsmA family protein [Methyloceanibacter sp.]|nr:AsmA family protein [Methyloceanibacter sp.]